MSRRKDPELSSQGFPWGCGVGLAIYTLVMATVAVRHFPSSASTVGFVFLVPVVAITLHYLYGLALLAAAKASFARSGARGLLIYSNSPNWQSYIEENWILRYGHQLRVLNWSERASWKGSLEVRIFRHFIGGYRNFNPAVLILRGLRQPVVFRFFYAFRDFKHDRPEALHRLETRLQRELGE